MLVIELNEFNLPMLSAAAEKIEVPALRKLLALQRSTTVAVEREGRFGLDLWVQWVPVRTGMPADEHGIHRVGDAYRLEDDQQLLTNYSINFDAPAWSLSWSSAIYRKIISGRIWIPCPMLWPAPSS